MQLLEITDTFQNVADDSTLQKAFEQFAPKITIVQEGAKNRMTIFLSKEIQTSKWYAMAVANILRMKEGDVIDVVLDTPGGVISSATMLTHALYHTPATVRGFALGKVISSGTLIAAECLDEIYISDSAIFMFHGASGGMIGKISEIAATTTTFDAFMQYAFERMREKKFITEDEIKQIVEHRSDLYISGADMKKRLEPEDAA
jgi:ATP-dependent protease ClpP protease subunit